MKHTAARSSTLIIFIKRSRRKRGDIPLPYALSDRFNRLIGAGREPKATVPQVLDHLSPLQECRTAHLWHRRCNTIYIRASVFLVFRAPDVDIIEDNTQNRCLDIGQSLARLTDDIA